jgi:hypothetical protein
MGGLLVAIGASAALAFSAFAFGYAASPASAHRHGCHRWHSCPSDHATYRWGPKRLLCVKPTSEKRNASFRIRVRYSGLTYWCKR